jgi:DNA-binding transcriptional LysR family regulator
MVDLAHGWVSSFLTGAPRALRHYRRQQVIVLVRTAIMQATDWSDYQAFLAIARSGRLARAGQAMGVDATTIGRRLRRLEARLGQTLFEHTRDSQVLTEAGEVLLVAVEAMAKAAADVAESRGSTDGPSGTLRISVAEGFGSWFLARRLPEFLVAYPNLSLDLVANSGFLNPSRREADIAVVLSRPKAGPLIASKLANYALRLYASATYLAASATPTKPSDLISDYRLVGYIPDLIYAPELLYLDEFHAGLIASVRSSSINAQHQLLAAGAGIGVLPCFIGDADPGLVPVLPDHRIVRSFWLVTHKDNHKLAKIIAAKAWLTNLVESSRSTLVPS